MITKESAFQKISELVERFEEQYTSYMRSEYNETLTRRDFIDPFFKALGWDMDNEQGYAEAYREVIHEDRLRIGTATKAPDYSFKLAGGKRLFFVEAKKPGVSVKDEIQPAYQIRRYGWSAKLPISIITDFQELSIYDCTVKPNPTDKASVARIGYLTFQEYLSKFDFIWDTFSKERVLKGSFDKFVQSDTQKKGTATVDKEFLQSLDRWRTYLATSISWNNKELDEDEINFAVQQTIDRIIFLRIAEDRSVEPYGNLKHALSHGEYYQNLFEQFRKADEKYNSGLFDFHKDRICEHLKIDNKVIKTLINEMYYPECPYEFSVLSVEILGSAYEQFLGKVIRITPAHHAKIEEKPEVRKAGGVYYTPQYIVEYIVKNTVGKLVEGKTPAEVEKIKIVDPACGSGSFLIGAYQYLLDWHLNYYNSSPVLPVSLSPGQDKGTRRTGEKGKSAKVLTPDGNLTTAEKKRILLNNIYGVDIDVNAVEVTKLSLLLKCLEGETMASIQQQFSLWNERVLPTLDNNIKSGNSLIDADFYASELDFGLEKKIKPFNWQKAFPEVFKQGGFDAVIGNPPYGAEFNSTEKDYLTKTFKVSEGNLESFSFFIERAENVLKLKGLLGYIIPDTWFTLKSSYKLRKFTINELSINEIQMLNEKVFKSAKVDVCTFILMKDKRDEPFNVYIYDKDATEIEMQKGEFITVNSFTKNDIIDDAELSFRFKHAKSTKTIIQKISSQKNKLDDYCTIGSGCKPYEIGKGTPPQTKGILERKIYNSTTKLNQTFRVLLRGADIGRYSSTRKNDEWLSYGKWLAAPRNPELFNNPRLLFQSIRNPKLKRRLVGTFVQDESVNNNSITNIILKDKNNKSLKFFLGILNSDLMNWYFSVSYNIVNIDPRYLKMIPIANSDKNKENEVISLVDQILKLNEEIEEIRLQTQIDQIKSKIDYCESRINDIVYKLYGLTEEEIRIVEGN